MADKLSTDEQYALLIRLGHRAGLVSDEHAQDVADAEEQAAIEANAEEQPPAAPTQEQRRIAELEAELRAARAQGPGGPPAEPLVPGTSSSGPFGGNV